MSTLGLTPPKNATVLFDGTSLDGWTTRNGGQPGWRVEEGIATVVAGTGDIVNCEPYEDAYIHLEFRCPDMPDKTGQAKGNSGVYVQARYEIQVLDSYGWEVPGLGDCGAIYNVHAPIQNACKPAMEWQTYDIVFRAARCDAAGNVVEKARMTVIHNGLTIHNNVELVLTGGAMSEDESQPGPLLLQDHGDLVSYRNIWLVHLPKKGSDQYEPR
jgi:hypothetical protein